tara:strand:+ start:173 stop:463 length:291 start_codon:yes stop_codon:yes gene_type:complete
MKFLIKSALLLLLVMTLTGCAAGGGVGIDIDRAIKQHAIASKSINLRDTKESVLSILEPTQTILSPNQCIPKYHDLLISHCHSNSIENIYLELLSC